MQHAGLLAQGRLLLDPGQWSVMVVAAQPHTARTAIWRGRLTTVPPDDELRLSDVVPVGGQMGAIGGTQKPVIEEREDGGVVGGEPCA